MEDPLHEITDEMIEGCNDVKQLVTWRRELKMSANKMKARLDVIDERFNIRRNKEMQGKYVRTADARAHTIAKIETINLRLRELRGSVNKPKSSDSNTRFKEYVKYLKEFRSLAKETLDEETFNALDTKAREASGFTKEETD